MILHNIKLSIRGMMRNKTFTFLNIVGFAVGFAVCIIIIIYAHKEYSADSSFPDADNIYRLIDVDNQKVNIDKAVIPQLQQFSDVKLAVPLVYANWGEEGQSEFLQDAATGNNTETKGTYIGTNNDFFKLLDIKTIVSKAEKPFADNKSMVLTQSLAMQMYGNIDVLDKKIKKGDTFFTVSAVVADMPANSSMNAVFFISDQNPDYELSLRFDKDDKKYFARNIYLLLNKNTNVADFSLKLNANFPQNTSLTKTVSLQSLTDIYMSKPLKDDLNKKGNNSLIYVFLVIALLTLIMSVFNYVNFMISGQMASLKNSGIRITNGAKRSQIRAYYFTEVIMAVFVAFVLALLIAQISMPYAEQLLDSKLGLHLLLKIKPLSIFAILFIVVVFSSAIAPLTFISRLKVQTLFGKTNIKSRKHPIKKIMNISQMSISIILLVAVLVVNKQIHYVKSTDVGFKTSHLLRLNIPWGYKTFDVLKNEFSKLPFVQHLSLSSHTPGAGWSKWGMKNKEGKEILINVIRVDKDFLKTFNINLQQGREFKNSDMNKAYYFTDCACRTMGWETLEDIVPRKNQKVVAIVNDIYYNSLHSKMVPVAFFYSDKHFGGLNLKLAKGDLSKQMAAIEKVWKKTMNNEPFSFNFYDQYFDSLYKKEEKQSKALSLFSIIAFMITCLGLLGQILQTTQNRIKEIGIRKINGASIKEVMLLLNKDFIRTIIIAFVIASPIAYYAMNLWLENFAYKTAISWWIFALAGISAAAIALLTVSWQSWRAASRNPVEALRYE